MIIYKRFIFTIELMRLQPVYIILHPEFGPTAIKKPLCLNIQAPNYICRRC
jgi:hypothetical protein